VGRSLILWMLAGAACATVPSSDTDPKRADIDSAVIGVIRGIDHTPQPDAQLRLGGNTQEADLDGMATTLHIPPGTIPANGLLEGHATAHAPVEVQMGWDATVQLYVAPLASYEAQVTDGETAISEPGVFALRTEVDGLWIDDAPANAPLSVEVAVVDRPATLAMPGSQHGLRLDTIIEPISLYYAIRIQRASDEAWRFENSGTLSIDLAGDDPMREVDDLYWYWYSSEQGYWRRAGPVSIEGDQASGPVNLFAWWAIGSPELREEGCVSGRVEDSGGTPLAWAEVLVSAAGHFGTRRARTSYLGEFCISTPLSADVTAQVFGISQSTGARHLGSASFVTDGISDGCDGICTDAGLVVATEVRR